MVLRLRIGGVDPSGTADGRGVLLSGSRPDPPDFILGPADGRAWAAEIGRESRNNRVQVGKVKEW